MSLSADEFWQWFPKYAARVPSNDIPDRLQDELIAKLHEYDSRLFFLMSTEANARELIITADGNKDAFGSADLLVGAAPGLKGWTFVSLKPPMGFDFEHSDGPISLDVSQLWFLPTHSSTDPPELGVIIGLPNVDFVLERQSVDTAYTILETAIGERSCAGDIAQVSVDELPVDPDKEDYLPLPQLPDYIAFHKRRYLHG